MREKLEKYIYDNKDNIISSLMELVKIPSIVTTGDDEFPCGKEVFNALLKVKELFEESGFSMEINKKDSYALHRTNEKETSIGIFTHADVVPVNDDWIYTKPFEPKEINGKLFGRGIEDNKSGVIGALFALKALRECGFDLKSDMCVFVGGCEEIGMADIEGFSKNEKAPTVSLVPDSEFPVSYGEKGIIRMAVQSLDKLSSVIAFDGGLAFNVVLDNVLVKLKYDDMLFSEIKEKREDATTDGEVITLSFKGIPKHAAMPEGSENAAFRAAEFLCSLKNIPESDKKILKCVYDMCEKYYGEALGISAVDEFGKLTCATGITSVKEGKMYFTFDVRYGESRCGEEILKIAKNTVSKYGYEVVLFEDMPGFLNDKSSEVTQAIIKTYREFTGDLKAEAYTSGGGTYARHVKNAYAIGTTLVKGKEGLDLPKGHGDIHESDECLDIDGFLKAITLLAITIYNLDKAL